MARRGLTFDSVSLQTSNIVTTRIDHESYDNRNLIIGDYGLDDGGKLSYERRQQKTINVSGHLSYSSRDNLDSAVDTFKKNMNGQVKNLDIEYAGTTRRYVSTLNKMELDRDYYNITFVPFAMEFVCTDGFGIKTTETTTGVTAFTTTVDQDIQVDGTLAPKPSITISVNGASDWNRTIVTNTTTNRAMTIDVNLSTNDELIINNDTQAVTLNGINQEFSGVFPEFTLGENNYKVSPFANYANYDVVVSYNERYL